MNRPKLHVIGELMNNSYARARKAWQARDIAGYQELARIQTDLGVSYLTLNIDGTQKLPVTLQEMLDFLPQVIPAIQEVTSVPLSFDNPDVAFHRQCLKYYDAGKSHGRPILNSISVLKWDARTQMPPGGGETRGYQLATLSRIAQRVREGASLAAEVF